MLTLDGKPCTWVRVAQLAAMRQKGNCDVCSLEERPCNCLPCANFYLCGARFPCNLRIGASAKGICMNCDVSFGKPLVAVRLAQPQPCPVCVDDTITFIEWPGCDGRHAFCVKCFSAMAWPQTFSCDGTCGYTDDELAHLRRTHLGANPPPRVAPWCKGNCCSDFNEEACIDRCPLCRAPREDASALWSTGR
jgi:hypothetical protein